MWGGVSAKDLPGGKRKAASRRKQKAASRRKQKEPAVRSALLILGHLRFECPGIRFVIAYEAALDLGAQNKMDPQFIRTLALVVYGAGILLAAFVFLTFAAIAFLAWPMPIEFLLWTIGIPAMAYLVGHVLKDTLENYASRL
jgi:hypothetical protein